MDTNSEVGSPNEMQIDGDDLLPIENEKEDVAIINPESDIPRADDYEAMKKFVWSPLPDSPEILDEVVHTWNIKSWRSLGRKEHGPIFEAGGVPWRVLMFPSGNNVDFCSFYLEFSFPEDKPPAEDWYCCVQFSLVLWNPNDPTVQTRHSAHHRFTREEADWGFTRFVELRKLFNVPWESSTRPLVENEAANMSAYVQVVKDPTGVLWHSFNNYDSKKETGFVGLKNQGATCYLNSLLQSLYFTNAFRKAVYQIPTENEDSLSNSAYTLQRLFCLLQTSQTAVSTNELTKSFGWETRHIFEQQDVQELSRKLMERLEIKMKGTDAENVLSSLFCGKEKMYVSCVNVEYESSRIQDFWDIQLNVIGNKTLEDSFKDYLQVEMMDGDNQYFAGDEFKLQDARKGSIFQSFPPVLHLQLKRFQYDVERDAMMKINDRYEFPETFDAAPYLSEDADKSEPHIYKLHGVLVHNGDLNAGHYYAFIKPTKDGFFYKYDDDRVIRATMSEVLEDNYGGDSPNGYPRTTQKLGLRQTSAYMLVYIRESRVDQVLVPVTKDDSPPHLQEKLDAEAAMREAKKKEREEQHLYIITRVVTEDIFKSHSGTDLASFESVEKDSKAALWYKMLRMATMKDLAVRVGNEIGQDPRKIRFWAMVNRQNKTTRPDQPINDQLQSIEESYVKAASKLPEFRVWAEVAEEVDTNGSPIWAGLSNKNEKSDNIILFLKWFDIEHQTLRGVGHIYIGKDRKVEDLVPIILKKMAWEDKPQLKLYEEIKPQMIDPMKAKQTLKAAELQDGDIICFQRASSTESDKDSVKNGKTGSTGNSLFSTTAGIASPPKSQDGPTSNTSPPGSRSSAWIEDAQSFYEYLLWRRNIHLMPHPRSASNYAALNLEISGRSNYDLLAVKVGERINVDPTHLRFYTVNGTTGNPKTPVKRAQNQILSQILSPPYATFGSNNQRADELYFEVLDMSLSELDTKKSVKIVWLSEGITKEEPYEILVPKNGSIGDLVAGLSKKAQLEDETTKGPIRVYGVHSNKVQKIYSHDHNVIGIVDYMTLYAERLPEDEVDSRDEYLISAFHYQSEPSKSHGVPFTFKIIQDEVFSETKKRLEKRTGIKGKNFEKIKFTVVRRAAFTKPIPLADDDVLWDVAIQDDDLLGLDHVDRRPARNGAVDLFLK